MKKHIPLFLFLSIITFSCSPTPPEQIIDAFYIQPDFVDRGVKGDLFPTQLLAEAEKAYQNADYAAAINTLQKMPRTSGKYNHSVYLIATIALKQGDGQLAVDQFKSYLKSQDQRFIEQAKFSLALAYLRNEEIDQAKQQISYILKNKNDFSRSYVEKASEIQQLMDPDF